MTRKIVMGGSSGVKDVNGAYLPIAPTPPIASTNAKSIDDLLVIGKAGVERLLGLIVSNITAGSCDRETAQVLKDCLSILHDLKAREDELFDTMSEEDLERAAAE